MLEVARTTKIEALSMISIRSRGKATRGGNSHFKPCKALNIPVDSNNNLSDIRRTYKPFHRDHMNLWRITTCRKMCTRKILLTQQWAQGLSQISCLIPVVCQACQIDLEVTTILAKACQALAVIVTCWWARIVVHFPNNYLFHLKCRWAMTQ